MKLAERMSRLGSESAFEVLARARALERQGKQIIHLEIGEPDFPSPPHVIEAGKRYILAVGTVVGEGYAYYDPVPTLRRVSFGAINSTASGDSSSVDSGGSSWAFALRITSTLPPP